jgi:hypothetical protein
VGGDVGSQGVEGPFDTVDGIHAVNIVGSLEPGVVASR